MRVRPMGLEIVSKIHFTFRAASRMWASEARIPAVSENAWMELSVDIFVWFIWHPFIHGRWHDKQHTKDAVFDTTLPI